MCCYFSSFLKYFVAPCLGSHLELMQFEVLLRIRSLFREPERWLRGYKYTLSSEHPLFPSTMSASIQQTVTEPKGMLCLLLLAPKDI